MSLFPLESNPDVLNKFMHLVGVPDKFKIVDVYGLDNDALAWIPRPVIAMILLFPCSEKYYEHVKREQEFVEDRGQVITPNIWFMRQNLSNACGTIALIHSVANNTDRQYHYSINCNDSHSMEIHQNWPTTHGDFPFTLDNLYRGFASMQEMRFLTTRKAAQHDINVGSLFYSVLLFVLVIWSGRENYGDNAVGFVQVKRDGVVCTVKGKITPEHNVKKKAYSVVLEFNEREEEINYVKCEDCAAHLGGCKHSIAFLTWVHRRSEDLPSTSVACYWKKSKLSSIGSSLKFILARDIGTSNVPSLTPGNGDFLNAVLESSKCAGRMNTQITKYFRKYDDVEKLSVHYLLHSFYKSDSKHDKDFFQFCQEYMKEDICTEAAMRTIEQRNSSLWFELRYARITASKAYDVMHCKKTNGVLVEQILGATKLKDTEAMKRGRILEKKVLHTVQKKTGLKFRECGLMLHPQHPFIGASPDGLCDECVVEIKCPFSENALKKYITSKNEISAKYLAQVQMQMYLCKRDHCLFCVASNDFEESNSVNIITVPYDEEYCLNMIQMCNQFWINIIFPRIRKTFE